MQWQKMSECYKIEDAADTGWPGSFVRVWKARALVSLPGANSSSVVLKVLRPKHALITDSNNTLKPNEVIYKQFDLEITRLLQLQDRPDVIRMYDFGYITSTCVNAQPIRDFFNHPPANKTEYDDKLSRLKLDVDMPRINDQEEEIISLGMEEASLDKFRELIPEAMTKCWIPYITLEYLPFRYCLGAIVRSNEQKKGRRVVRLMPHDIILIAEQYLALLDHIHQLDPPLYNCDTKPGHVYWFAAQKQLRMIDWNHPLDWSGKHPDNLIKRDIEMLVFDFIFPAFTGLRPLFTYADTKTKAPISLYKDLEDARRRPQVLELEFVKKVNNDDHDEAAKIELDKLDPRLVELCKDTLINSKFKTTEDLRGEFAQVAKRLGCPEFAQEEIRGVSTKALETFIGIRRSLDAIHQADEYKVLAQYELARASKSDRTAALLLEQLKDWEENRLP